MIVKNNLSPLRIAQYTRGPLSWAAAWSVAVPLAHSLTGWTWLMVPFAPVAAMIAALAIFVAFRNNASFARWSEARAAWQTMLVACRVLARQIVASADAAVAGGGVDRATADEFVGPLVRRLIALMQLGAAQVPGRPNDDEWVHYLPESEVATVRRSPDPVTRLLLAEGRQIKGAIRAGVLGQFDPIAMEPQLAALNTAAGVTERIRSTPTPRQYDFFTRRFVELLAVVMPMGILSLIPGQPVVTAVLSLLLSGMFIMMAVTGAANDEPLVGAVTDIPVLALAREAERDLLDLLDVGTLPPPLAAVDGYLW